MARTYEQVRKQWETLWAIGAADDISNLAEDDMYKMLKSPTRTTARICMELQIEYWLQTGPEHPAPNGSRIRLLDLLRNNPEVQEIAEDYGYA